ncbi:MAG: hypothetical protein MSA56_15795 [Clostridium sp.]|nr:hypothetical protein [Clostridium sp.]MCI7204624.1 hypothetical protein [Clostridium sp.]
MREIFLDWCKDEICKYTNKHLDITDNKKISKNYDELKEYDFEKMEKKPYLNYVW